VDLSVSVFGLFVGGALVAGLTYLFVSPKAFPPDRRLRARRQRFDLPLTRGTCARCKVIESSLDWPSAVGVAATALHNIGATDVGSVDSWTTIGWLPMDLLSFGQQVGVTIQARPDGGMTFWCCSRPRVTTTLIDYGRSERCANQLAAWVIQLIGQ
jgi:hypothetical protein